mgnify:CR=1 FL=1
MEELTPETTPVESTPKKSTSWGQVLRDALETILLAVVLFVVINALSARVRVDGFSMRPTLEDGEFVLVNKMSYRFGEVDRGDIIVFHFPLNPDEELIKKIVDTTLQTTPAAATHWSTRSLGRHLGVSHMTVAK